MNEKEKRLMRCIGEIDDPLVQEAENRRIPRKHWGGVLAVAACAALIVAVPKLWSQENTEQDVQMDQQMQSSTDIDAPTEHAASSVDVSEPEGCEPADGQTLVDQTWILGSFALGMTAQQAGVVPDESGIWTENGLTLRFDPFTGTICRMTAGEDCTVTLPNGLGVGSEVQKIEEAFPQAKPTEGANELRNGQGQILCYSVSGDRVSELSIELHGDCLLNALTSADLTIYTRENGSRLWSTVPVTEKAAKRICTMFTISELEPLETEEEPKVDVWIDFGDGAAASVNRELEYVCIYAYDGSYLDLSQTGTMRCVANGVVANINGPITQALADPTEIWETQPIEQLPEPETS